MPILGNIVHYDQLVNHTKVDYVNYIDTKNGHNNLGSNIFICTG